VVGSSIYQDVKDAHEYEAASRDFLGSAGYGADAAGALS
jgi:hypothetical protein